MPEEEPTVVLTLRVADIHESMVVQGSIIVDCETCGAEVWLSPATAKFAAGKGWPVWCVQCVNDYKEAERGGGARDGAPRG